MSLSLCSENIPLCIDSATYSLQLEKQVNEVEQFYESTANIQVNSKGSSIVKDKGQEKHLISAEKQLQDASRREAAAAKRMQELMRQFSTILRQARAKHLVVLPYFILCFRYCSFEMLYAFGTFSWLFVFNRTQSIWIWKVTFI